MKESNTSQTTGLRASRRLAFTLIELLVVISIIALLISILLPALGSARDTAIMLQCLSQTRSLGQATHMYQADNQQYYDYGLDSRGGTNLFHNDTLNNYLGLGETWDDTREADTWHCPDVADEAAQARDNRWVLYTSNANLMGWVVASGEYYSTSYGPAGSGNQNIKEADIKESPSSTAMWQEGYFPIGWVTPTRHSLGQAGGANFIAPHFSSTDYTWGGITGTPTHPDERFGGGRCSVTFMDGSGGNYGVDDFPAFGSVSGNLSYQIDR